MLEPDEEAQAPEAFDVVRPARGPHRPIVFGAAHAGFEWPDARSAAARDQARDSWDAHLGHLLEHVPLAGATLVMPRFARGFVDVDLTEREVEEGLLAAHSPDDEVEWRLRTFYRPYREAVRAQLREAEERHDDVWLFEMRAVPSRGRRGEVDAGQLRPDVVVSDRMGTTADSDLTARVIEWFDALGFRVQMNDPFRGGDLIGSLGNPRAGRHCVQVAVNRALYLNERTFEMNAGASALKHTLTTFAHEVGRWTAWM